MVKPIFSALTQTKKLVVETCYYHMVCLIAGIGDGAFLYELHMRLFRFWQLLKMNIQKIKIS